VRTVALQQITAVQFFGACPLGFIQAVVEHFFGIVAKTRECASVGRRLEWPPSDRQPKQLVDKLQLRERVTFAHPSGSPLPNHVDRLDAL
jgi:hypothetical protein